MIQIRNAALDDAQELLNIYSYYVRETAISFEYEPPSIEEWIGRMGKTMKKFPYLVAVEDGKPIGYAYAGTFIPRAAYDRCCELTIYLSPDAKKRGAGKMLYSELERRLEKMGILNLYACIGVPDTDDEYLDRNSEQFHRHMGFTLAGKFRKCGYKFGRWYHMIWMEKMIGRHIMKDEDE